MTDIINLNSIRSDNCDCNKPKLHSCGCHNNKPCPPPPCHQSINLGDLYFKVKNLFSELKSEWQRTEARSNLGITDIVGLKLIKVGVGSNDTNIWLMEVSKSGSLKFYEFVVTNGEKGESATVDIVRTNTVAPDKDAKVENVSGDLSHLKLIFDIPKGETGETGAAGPQGERGKSAYELAVESGFVGSLQDWLNSLKGEPGANGTNGADGLDGSLFKIKEVTIVAVETREIPLPNGETYSGKIAKWRIILENGEYREFWTPLQVDSNDHPSDNPGEDSATYRYNIFLFKTVTFSEIPTETLLESKRNDLLRELSQGHLDGWNEYASAITEDGCSYIFMATCVVTNEVYGPWSVIRLTPKPGEEGPEGPSGPSSSSSSSQGFIGPTIRMRGTWSSSETYVNETYKPYSSNTEIHFIDVVFYSESDAGNWYSVKPKQSGDGVLIATLIPPKNNSLWEKATNFDFAFIGTLIANAISAVTIDTDEIRIHDRRNPNYDRIVAGMTSGGNATYTYNDTTITEDISNDSSDPVRIWAGTNVNIKTENDINLNNAPFKVHQSGKLYASNADVEGTIQANTLRLGVLDQTNKGTFLAPTNSTAITLPKLVLDRVQVFYLLTNLVQGGQSITVNAQTSDKIQESGDTQLKTSFTAKYEKLYLLFGMDSGSNLVWYVVEQDMKAASGLGVASLVPGKDFTVSYKLQLETNWEDSKFYKPELDGMLILTNYTDEPILIIIAPFKISRDLKFEVEGYTAEGNVTMTVNNNMVLPVTPTNPQILHFHMMGDGSMQLTSHQDWGVSVDTDILFRLAMTNELLLNVTTVDISQDPVFYPFEYNDPEYPENLIYKMYPSYCVGKPETLQLVFNTGTPNISFNSGNTNYSSLVDQYYIYLNGTEE